jgi:predicted MFS family arabinose efflux permease
LLKLPQNIAFLTLAILLIPTFILWVSRQERLHRPAIIPNSIWRKTEFTSICITVFLVWASFNAFGYWVTLLFQEYQGISALQTSIRFLPLVVVGLITNVVAGALVDRVSAVVLVVVGSVLSAASPIIFANLNSEWSYWFAAYPAICLSPISSDILFNIANLVITASFPENEQALAGGVFSTVTQLGNSVGLAVTAMVAAIVTQSAVDSEGSKEATLKGYKTAFWTCFAAAAVSCITACVGLRKSGKVGLKRD